MTEHEEHMENMKVPEEFRLELPPGHTSHRPISALLGGLLQTTPKIAAICLKLEGIRDGKPLTAYEVGELLGEFNDLGAALTHNLNCLKPIHLALHDMLMPQD